jgi:hypothetical protein
MKKPNPHYKRKIKVRTYADRLREAAEKGNQAAIEAHKPNKYTKYHLSKYDL